MVFLPLEQRLWTSVGFAASKHFLVLFPTFTASPEFRLGISAFNELKSEWSSAEYFNIFLL